MNGKHIVLPRGSAFKAKLPPGSDKEHICVILNKKVRPKTIIHYVYITSQKDSVYKRLKHDPNAIVVINPSEYKEEISRTSYVQCSKAYVGTMTYSEFISNYTNGNYDFSTKNPSVDVINKITYAISCSRTFSFKEIRNILS